MFPWPWGCLAPFHCDSVSSRFRAGRLSLMLPRARCRHAQPVSIQCWSSLGGLCINSHLGWMADPGCPTPTFTDSQFHTSRLFCFFFFLLRRSPTTLFVLILKPIGPFRLIEWFSSQSQILGQPTSPSHWSVQWPKADLGFVYAHSVLLMCSACGLDFFAKISNRTGVTVWRGKKI